MLYGTNSVAKNIHWATDSVDAHMWSEHYSFTDYLDSMVNGARILFDSCYDLQFKYQNVVDQLRGENFTLALVDNTWQPVAWVLASQLDVPYVLFQPCVGQYDASLAIGPVGLLHCDSGRMNSSFHSSATAREHFVRW